MRSTQQRVRFTATDYTRMASILAGRRTELIGESIPRQQVSKLLGRTT